MELGNCTCIDFTAKQYIRSLVVEELDRVLKGLPSLRWTERKTAHCYVEDLRELKEAVELIPEC